MPYMLQEVITTDDLRSYFIKLTFEELMYRKSY